MMFFGGEGDGKKEQTIAEYIFEHNDPMSAHLFGMHLPHFKLPDYLSFLHNVKDATGNYVELQITANMAVMFFSAIALMFLLTTSVRRKDGSLTRFGVAVEGMLLWLRNDIAIANLGDRLGRAFTPFLASVFFFIFFMNYFSLLPGSSTPTSNVMLTAALAISVMVVIEIQSLKELGLKHYLLHLTADTPPALWLIMVPIEIIGKFAKPFALAIRLFANMTAGHIIIYALLGLTGTLGLYLVAPLSVLMALFVYLIEILVSFLQAFIFTMLSALFIGLATTSHHDESHGTAH